LALLQALVFWHFATGISPILFGFFCGDFFEMAQKKGKDYSPRRIAAKCGKIPKRLAICDTNSASLIDRTFNKSIPSYLLKTTWNKPNLVGIKFNQ
jgi:hypothetical protein